MPLVQAKCTNCGASLEVDNSSDALICKHCGSAFIVEKAINYYQTYNTTYVTTSGSKTLFSPAQGFTDVSKGTGGTSRIWNKNSEVVRLNEISHRFDNAIQGCFFLKSDGTLGYIGHLSEDPSAAFLNPIPFSWKNLVDFHVWSDEYRSTITGITSDGKKHIADMSCCEEKIEKEHDNNKQEYVTDTKANIYTDNTKYVEEYSNLALRTDGLFEAKTKYAFQRIIQDNIDLLQQRGDKYIRYVEQYRYCITTGGRLDEANLDFANTNFDFTVTRGRAENVIGICGSMWRNDQDSIFIIYSDGHATNLSGKETITLFVGKAEDYKKKISAKVPDTQFNIFKEALINRYKNSIKWAKERRKSDLKAYSPILCHKEREKTKQKWDEWEAKFQKALEISMGL